jgi:serine phosphatase RsbU (regulator of sigma subunit)
MPAKMFVTCLFAILDPTTGHIVIANAGHNLPFVRTGDEVTEIRATGMPLGLMPGIRYEETEGVIGPDSNVLLYSDGLIEAHDDNREMFGCVRRCGSTTPGASCWTDFSRPSTHSPGPIASRRTTSRS